MGQNLSRYQRMFRLECRRLEHLDVMPSLRIYVWPVSGRPCPLHFQRLPIPHVFLDQYCTYTCESLLIDNATFYNTEDHILTDRRDRRNESNTDRASRFIDRWPQKNHGRVKSCAASQ